MLASFTIDDDLTVQETGAVEVTLRLENGERRWCYFMTPAALSACGDLAPGSNIRYHCGAPHMIVVAVTLDVSVIELVLRDIDDRGELAQCSLPVE